MFMHISLLLVSSCLFVVPFVIQPVFPDSFVTDYQQNRYLPRGTFTPESEQLTERYTASNDVLRRPEISRAEELPPRLDAFELFLYNIGYGTKRGGPSRDPLGCRRNPEDTVHRGRRLFSNKAEPCFEDNDLMTSFNTKPVSNPGHSLFIPAHHPSELRSRELRRYQEAVYQRLLILLNNFRMNRRTKNWNAQGNSRTQDPIGDWYNDEKEVESSHFALDTML
uniref:Uncharacterized protein n=1 Tax=Haemonchus contortus TaxID=6289 RepID=A0A7I5EC41_HAECO